MSSESKNRATPSDIIEQRWTLSRRVIRDRLIVQHDLQPPNEVEHPPSTHHFMALHLTHSNRIARIGNHQYEGAFNIGEFCLHPCCYSGFYAWDSTDEVVAFIIRSDFLSRLAAQTECLNPDRIELRPVAIGRDPDIEHIARSFLGEMETESLGVKIYSETLAVQLAIHLLRHYCTFPPRLRQYDKGLSRTQLQRVIDYINAYLESNISLPILAELSGVSSPYYFCHLFKQSTGIAPYQYVIQQRVAKAKQLLKQQNLPLVEIALSCGFSSQSAFNRTFKKSVGTTPSEYRRQL